MTTTKFALVPISKIKRNPKNPCTHSEKQIGQIETSISTIGFTVPVVLDENHQLLAGHGRLIAAKRLRYKEVPSIIVSGASEAVRRVFAVADNKIAENSGWDRQALAIEFEELAPLLAEQGFDLELTGFAPAEIDAILGDLVDPETEPAETLPSIGATAVSHAGDCWVLGVNRLFCGDARDAASYTTLMGRECAAMAFLDSPYNVKISSIGGRGKTKHREFAAASGEMNSPQFAKFLTDTHTLVAAHCSGGALVYSCMDWRHMGELLTAGSALGELKNVVVWVKSNAGQGSFYRSQHELIFVFKVGQDSHRNNVELGRYGRNRSNVWHYAGVNSFRSGRMEELSFHPTVKPVAMVADAMRDCTRRGDIVLDAFCGSGTTILAAERVGRRGFGMEIDPLYVDVAVRRWQDFTKCDAILSGTRKTFRQIEAARSPSGPRRRA